MAAFDFSYNLLDNGEPRLYIFTKNPVSIHATGFFSLFNFN